MLPLWLKIGYAAFLAVLIPVYYKKYGPANFLWFSDIALFGVALGLWFENALLVSIVAVTVFLPELAWNIDYFLRLLSGKKLIGLSGYMFNRQLPLYLRAISLFHVVLPVVMLYILGKLGYDERAVYIQPFVAWGVILVTYFFTDPKENINLVFGFGDKPQQKLPSAVYLLLIMAMFPILLYLPTHFLLKWLF